MRGIKARIIGTAFETTVIPYFPEGMFAGFTDVTGSLQPGMVVYKPSDLEFLETPPKLKPEVDWDAFRREAAKDFMSAIIVREAPQYNFACRNVADRATEAIMWAEELIEQLKQAEDATEESEKSMVQRKV